MTLVTQTTEPTEAAGNGNGISTQNERSEPRLVAPAESTIGELVQLFKLLADDTRLRILSYLQQSEELNVREMCQLLRQRQPLVSHHLAMLRGARLIEMRREGKHNFYRLVPAKLEQLITTCSGNSPGHPARICFDGFELRYSPTALDVGARRTTDDTDQKLNGL